MTEPTTAGDLTLFPVNFVWESDTRGLEEAIIRNETNRGVITEYELSHRSVLPAITFEFFDSQYSTFETFINATRALDFWFVPDSSVMATKYNVRRNPGLLPKAQAPARYSGTMEQRFSWTLSMTVLVEDVEIED